MTAPTRPAPPRPAPPGQRWVVALAEDAQPVAEVIPDGRDRKCRMLSVSPQKHNPCNAVALIVIGREPRCANHMQGRWVEHGIVMTWALEPIEEER